MERAFSAEYLTPQQIMHQQFMPLDFSEANTPAFESADSGGFEVLESYRFGDRKQARWSPGEIELLARLKQNDALTYDQISRIFAQNGFDKSVQSIQQRWTKVQRPGLVKGRMTYGEERKIAQIFEEYNGDVRQIARQMPSRSIMQIRRKCQQLGLFSSPRGSAVRE